ncbi:response regulator [Desulfatiglans anilini]|uniref:response regulator n=1 Tax=Desulfatiglans anilini TaxID=90728 RepID=UPI0004241D1F|nr:response regulator [Desulfatiglans anilini]
MAKKGSEKGAALSRLEGKKVLIVDDEPDVLDSLEDLLPMCSITAASTFDEAAELLNTRHYDLAVLDIMGVDGFNLLQIARSRGVPAVMLTAHALSPENTLKSLHEGAASYVPKEKLNDIQLFLEDVLEARERGRSPWWRWLERLGSYYERKFGEEWKKEHKDFIEKRISY